MTKGKRTTKRVSGVTPASSEQGVDRLVADEAVARAVDEVVDDTISHLVKGGGKSSATKRSGVKSGKPKFVRDRFKIPKDEYATFGDLKMRLLQLSQSTKKSELLRAGLAGLTRLSDARLLAAIKALPSTSANQANGKRSEKSY